MTTARPYKIVDPFYRRPLDCLEKMPILPQRESRICVPDLAGDIEHVLAGGDENCIVEVADPAALQRAADQVTPQLVEHLGVRWLSQSPIR